MISKIVQAILVGMFVTFILDFFLFLGIFLDYIRRYEIDLYYNILFADHQSLLLYLLGTAVFGWLTIFYPKKRIALGVVGASFALSLMSLIPGIGDQLGKMMLMHDDARIVTHNYIYQGDIYYDGREDIYFYDRGLGELVKIPKSKLKP